ncbi:DNA oxidative demethylase AlkB [Candidimonas humi]|uniref:DNA oxidative demethylase AlkB n=1 Tax=Candidimonas humi TaxID=683355 RepID=A0ABV8NU78_9BURK|nr:DNA oxidative demethylase AlkB [Candidimonas humi]MBV6303709.1 DNA oxidative demethylase AlkB [Candidimonas humi]
MSTLDLFHSAAPGEPERIGPCAFVLHGYALSQEQALLSAIAGIEDRAPFRRMVTPGGLTMSAALTNCGALGWTTDRRGYLYTAADPDSGRPWPDMPQAFAMLARTAAAAAGFRDFEPDACLMNRYASGARMSLHQDKNERDFGAPIVSVSLGMSATFLFGGLARSDRVMKLLLHHGDVVVWGGEDRLRYHGVLAPEGATHPLLGDCRINLTFRKAG